MFKGLIQYKSFLKLLKEAPKSKVFLFTGRQDYRKTRLLCVALLQALRLQEFKPIWYLANGIFAKSVLQLKDNKALFIDSLSDEMATYKFDKVHDICQRHCDKTIILIHHGRNGFNLCVDRFGVNPSMVFNLDKTVGKKVINL